MSSPGTFGAASGSWQLHGAWERLGGHGGQQVAGKWLAVPAQASQNSMSLAVRSAAQGLWGTVKPAQCAGRLVRPVR